MNDRELRLRQRIDQLIDERDAALAELETVRAQLTNARRKNWHLSGRIWNITDSRNRWKLRAKER